MMPALLTEVAATPSWTCYRKFECAALLPSPNQRAATLEYDGQTWHVGFGLLRPLVGI